MLNKEKIKQHPPHRRLVSYWFYEVAEYILVVIFFVLLGLFLAWRPIQVARLTRDMEQLQKLTARMLEINARLNLEKAALIRLDRVEKKARQEYGFIDPNQNQLIDLAVDISSLHPL